MRYSGSGGTLRRVRSSFGPSRQDERPRHCLLGPTLHRKVVESFAPGGSWQTKGGTTKPQKRATWVAQAFRGRGETKHEYISETPDLASLKAGIEHAARWTGCGDTSVAVFDVRQAYFYTVEQRDFFVELPDYVPAARVSHVE